MPAPEPNPTPKWARALFQSVNAALFILLTFFAVYQFLSKLAIASLAASAFIAFGFPSAESARSRYIVGGYVCGVVCGGACCLLRYALPGAAGEGAAAMILFCGLAVLLNTFAMIMLNLQHPPANALAVAMVLETAPIAMGACMLACAVLLCLWRWGVVRLFGRRFEP